MFQPNLENKLCQLVGTRIDRQAVREQDMLKVDGNGSDCYPFLLLLLPWLIGPSEVDS